MLSKFGRVIVVGAFAAAVLAGTASVELTGVVSDSAGAVVPNAEVVLRTHGSTGVAAVSRTDGSGTFAFSNLRPQLFDLHVKAPGFRETFISNIDATVTDKIKIPPVKLEVGDPICILEVHAPLDKSSQTPPREAQRTATDTSYIFPESTIANVSIEGFLPDGRHYSAIVYLSGNFSSSYSVTSLPHPEVHVSDGWTNDKQFFELAEAASNSWNPDEIEAPTRKDLSDAPLPDAPSRYRDHVVILISPLEGKGRAKAYMRKYDGQFVSGKVRELETLLLAICDKRAQ